MPYYRLVASGRRPELNTEEIILERHNDGEPRHLLSKSSSNEIPEEVLTKARNLAYQHGFEIAEVEPPADAEEFTEESNTEVEQQPQEAAPDTAGQAPAVSPTGESGAEIDQQQTQQQTARASQQNAPGADAATTQGGTSASAATTQGGTPASSATTQGGVSGSSSVSTPPSNT